MTILHAWVLCGTINTHALQCFRALCSLLCGSFSGTCRGKTQAGIQWRAAVRAVRRAPQPSEGKAIHSRTGQDLSRMLQLSAACCYRSFTSSGFWCSQAIT
jgi:hypothetical protein